jgi:hypothetical protein
LPGLLARPVGSGWRRALVFGRFPTPERVGSLMRSAHQDTHCPLMAGGMLDRASCPQANRMRPMLQVSSKSVHRKDIKGDPHCNFPNVVAGSHATPGRQLWILVVPLSSPAYKAPLRRVVINHTRRVPIAQRRRRPT